MSATDTAPTPAAAVKKQKPTEYVVLELRLIADQGAGKVESWVEVTTVKATSRERAIHEMFGKDTSAGGGTFVAVPSNSWKRVQVSVETVSRVKLEDA